MNEVLAYQIEKAHRDRLANIRMRERRRRAGLCVACGAESVQSYCPRCAAKHAKVHRGTYAWCRDNNLCVRCRSEAGEHALCETCRSERRRKYHLTTPHATR